MTDFQHQSKLIAALQTLQNNFQTLCEYQALHAKLLYKFYTELIENGFTEVQALEIVKAKSVC